MEIIYHGGRVGGAIFAAVSRPPVIEVILYLLMTVGFDTPLKEHSGLLNQRLLRE